ncbi:MAG TPA: hypothetical protein VMF66_05850 [Candidatus Acidoferrum sp.]|nr:hypothetical protein [Candidatus Acidoferrum sp.]
MRRTLFGLALTVLALGLAANNAIAQDGNDRGHEFHFVPGSIVLTRTVYVGNASTVTIGENLPPGCVGSTNSAQNNVTVQVQSSDSNGNPLGTFLAVALPTCGYASDNGEYPNLEDSHNVWNNAGTDGDFGITSPIFLDNLTDDGHLLGTLPIPTDQMVTSFSSKSELALNRSIDGKSLTFVGYRGGPGCPVIDFSSGTGVQGTTSGPVSPTAPSLIDVSASNTPGLCDPTNQAIASSESSPFPTAYYRAVAEVDADGHIKFTDNNAYSGDNDRAAIKASNGLYYMAGNDNSGNIPKKNVATTVTGFDLAHATGAELLVPDAIPPVAPNIDMIGYFVLSGDKAGKDTNFRGLTIFNNTVYVTKGSGSNGLNSVFQVGSSGVLPTGSQASLIAEPINPLPGFPQFADAAASTSSTTGDFPFGVWFANANTLYVCDEGTGTYVPNQEINGQTNVADADTLANAGLQKWVLENGTWTRVYVLQNGLNLGVPYGIRNYPAALDPATDGCRNIAGRVNHDGTVTIWAVTSTVSTNGDTGADPNKLVMVNDVLGAKSLSSVRDPWLETFETVRSARAGEAFRGVALAPVDEPGRDDDGRNHN